MAGTPDSHRMGEFELIARYFTRPTPGAILGPGDDCALLRPSAGMVLAVTCDMLVEGIHFLPATEPRQLGWKSVAVNLSDLAAMGAVPRWLLLAGALPEADPEWLSAFAAGVFACADAYGVELVGGDTTRMGRQAGMSGPLCLSLTALGEVPEKGALRRDGARAGDDLWVSGTPGLAALGLLQERGREENDGGEIILPPTLAARASSAFNKPSPRVALGQALRERSLAHAAIDISDGLLADLGHLLRRSGLNAEVGAHLLPKLGAEEELAGISPELLLDCQLGGGDDYELVFAAAHSMRAEIVALADELSLPLTRVGTIRAALPQEERKASAAGTVTVYDVSGRSVTPRRRGYEHFKA